MLWLQAATCQSDVWLPWENTINWIAYESSSECQTGGLAWLNSGKKAFWVGDQHLLVIILHDRKTEIHYWLPITWPNPGHEQHLLMLFSWELSQEIIRLEDAYKP